MENDNTLSAKLTRIETAVDRIRVKTDTASDAIEDVATAVEGLKDPTGNINITNTSPVDVTNYATAQVVDSNLTAGNIKKDVTVLGITGTHEGGITPTGTIQISSNNTYDVTSYASAEVNVPIPAKSNIYKVSSIAERDLIDDMTEGDMCVVIGEAYSGLLAEQTFRYVKFPSTVTLSSAITSTNTVRVGSSYFTIRITATAFSISPLMVSTPAVTYTSSDGITYTRTDSLDSVVDFGSDYSISTSYYKDFISSFMLVNGVDFTGLFTYTSNEWVQSDVGITSTSSDILLNKKAYTNSGTVAGTRDLKKYRENYLYIQSDEPTNKTGIWGKLNEGISFSYDSTVSTKFEEVKNIYKHAKISNTPIDIKAQVVAKGTTTNNTYAFYRANIGYDGTYYEYRCGLVYNNILYLFIDKVLEVDLTTGNISEYNVNLNKGKTCGSPYLYNNHIYFVDFYKPESTVYTYLCKYNISDHTGSFTAISHNNGYGGLVRENTADNKIIGAGKYLYFRCLSTNKTYAVDRLDLDAMTYSLNPIGSISNMSAKAVFISIFENCAHESSDGINISLYNGLTINPMSITVSSLENIATQHPEYATYPSGLAFFKNNSLVIESDGGYNTTCYGRMLVYYRENGVWNYNKSFHCYDSLFDSGTETYRRYLIYYNNYVYILNGTGLYKKHEDDLFISNYKASIQYDDSQNPVQLEQNLTLPISDVFCYAGDDTGKVNAIKELYIGDGTSWTLYKTY